MVQRTMIYLLAVRPLGSGHNVVVWVNEENVLGFEIGVCQLVFMQNYVHNITQIIVTLRSAEVIQCHIEQYEVAATCRRPILAVPNVTAHPSTASVPITVLMCNDPSLCGFNVAMLEDSQTIPSVQVCFRISKSFPVPGTRYLSSSTY